MGSTALDLENKDVIIEMDETMPEPETTIPIPGGDYVEAATRMPGQEETREVIDPKTGKPVEKKEPEKEEGKKADAEKDPEKAKEKEPGDKEKADLEDDNKDPEDKEALEAEGLDPKTVKNFRKRLKKESGKRKEAEDEVTVLKSRIEKLENRTVDVKTDAGEEPQEEDFQEYTEFMKEWNTWKIKSQTPSKEKDREPETEMVIGLKQQDRSMRDAGRAKHEDYDKVVHDDLPISEIMAVTILDSPKAAEISYYLGKHPEEAETITRLAPGAQPRAIIELESMFIAGEKKTVDNENKNKDPKEDKINPVNTKTTVETVSDVDLPYNVYKKKHGFAYGQRGR